MENGKTRLYPQAFATALSVFALAVALWKHLSGNLVAVFGICLGAQVAALIWRYRTR